jgi:Flp pilus assembly protein TadG
MQKKSHRGGAAVEFALLLPLLLVILIGIAQFSWLIGNYIIVTHAAAVGAHLLASERGFSSPYTETVASVTNALGPLQNPLAITTSINGVACTSNSACQSALGTMTNAPSAGSTATVSLVYTFTPFFSGTLGGVSIFAPNQIASTMTEVIQ